MEKECCPYPHLPVTLLLLSLFTAMVGDSRLLAPVAMNPEVAHGTYWSVFPEWEKHWMEDSWWGNNIWETFGWFSTQYCAWLTLLNIPLVMALMLVQCILFGLTGTTCRRKGSITALVGDFIAPSTQAISWCSSAAPSWWPPSGPLRKAALKPPLTSCWKGLPNLWSQWAPLSWHSYFRWNNWDCTASKWERPTMLPGQIEMAILEAGLPYPA
jgi:hypothetical protein